MKRALLLLLLVGATVTTAVLGLSTEETPSGEVFVAQEAYAQQKCTDETVGVGLLVEIETRTANRNENGITGFDAFGNRTSGDVYNPPVLLERIGPIPCCFGLHRFFLGGQQVHEEGWNGGIDKDFSGQPGGGILFDTYQDHTSNGVFGAIPGTTLPGAFIEYSFNNSTAQQTFNVSDQEVMDAGTIADLLGAAFQNPSSESDNNLKTQQIVRLSLSGNGKIGVGDVNSTQNKDQGTGVITLNSLQSDFTSLNLFVCKDSQNNGICDAEECDPVADPLCSDGLDNDNDGLIDFPSDKGCTSPEDGDETNPACIDGTDNDNDGRTDFPEDPGCDDDQDTDETSPQCADGIDNDGDGVVDFENGDRGCDSARDNDETNPPIDRNITFSRLSRPTLVLQPSLARDERLIFEDPPPGCPTCVLTTTPDHTQFVGGDPNTPDNFIVTAEYEDSTDGSLFYIIVAVGDFTEHDELFRDDGRAYAGLGGLEKSSN